MINVFYTNGYFILDADGEIDTNRVFNDITEMAYFWDKIFDRNDCHPSIYYTGNIYRYFRNFKRLNMSQHGSGVKNFYNILEYEGRNCYILNGNACFLKCKKYFFKKDFSMDFFELIQS